MLYSKKLQYRKVIHFGGLSVHYAENMPTEKWIKKVMKLNNLSSATIQMGVELKMPLIKTNNRNTENTYLAKQVAGDDE